MPALQYVRGSPPATRTTIRRRSRRDQEGHAHLSRPHPLHELIRTLIINLSVLLCHPFPIPPKHWIHPLPTSCFKNHWSFCVVTPYIRAVVVWIIKDQILSKFIADCARLTHAYLRPDLQRRQGIRLAEPEVVARCARLALTWRVEIPGPLTLYHAHEFTTPVQYLNMKIH